MLVKFVTALAVLASLATAVPCTGSGDVIDACTNPKTVALTFDDGPRGQNWEKKVADTIAAQGGRATFFLNGNNYGCIYDEENVQQLRRIYEAGHVLASHTWSHADITKLSTSALHQELEKLETAFVKILGVKPKYFRPPYGNLDDAAINVLKDRGYSKIWLWDVDSGDSVGASVSAQKNTLTKAMNDGNPHLVLQHSPQDNTVSQTTPWEVPLWAGKGYQMVTVNQCIPGAEDWPYQYVSGYGTRDSTWKC